MNSTNPRVDIVVGILKTLIQGYKKEMKQEKQE
jgi:hypothetical protein